MKNIKSYEDFCNEEINWKKALTGAAIAASTLGGMTSCNKEEIKPIQQTEQVIDSKYVGNWEARITNSFDDLSCKITLNSDGTYIVSEHMTYGPQAGFSNNNPPVLKRGNYQIIDNYNYTIDQGLETINSVGTVIVFEGNVCVMREEEDGYKYILSKDLGNCGNLGTSLGFPSDVSIATHFKIVKSF